MSQPPSPFEPNPWAPPQEGAADQQTRIGDPPPAPHAPGPGYGYGPQTPYPFGGYAPPPERPKNGMSIASLVLGVVGFLAGFLILFFWLSWLPAVLAVIFGLVGLGQVKRGTSDSKGLAVSGLVLGVLGVLLAVGGGFITVFMVKKGADGHDRVLQVEAPESREAADARSKKAAEKQAAEKARHLKFGETYTYPSGLKVTVAKPVPYAFDDYNVSIKDTKGKKALQVVVTVVNGSPEPIDFKTSLPQVTDAQGNDADLVIDGSGRQEIISGKVGPGTKKVGKTAYAMPEGATGSLEVIFNPDLAVMEDVTWTGPTA
ncbi:DUF4190 domain-containing protein [Streptomyces sp. NPDC087440]|uniref:DUF4190 domain-containing protein n=1 Tax=Streptomyces sp. NPDC087440 TaxID=3365790 RepID=UPI003800E558